VPGTQEKKTSLGETWKPFRLMGRGGKASYRTADRGERKGNNLENLPKGGRYDWGRGKNRFEKHQSQRIREAGRGRAGVPGNEK